MFSLLSKAKKTARAAPVPETRTLDLGGRQMPLTIRKHERATRITLRIEPGGRALKMTVPHGVPSREINAFLDRHQGWLITKLAKFGADAKLCDGGEILIRGVLHQIEHSGSLRGVTE
ncbi:MAG: YgjP-like metallopeptidase domain-containing protein, partial [Rhizobium sp.]